jgi:hypothetical protein
MSLQEPLEQQRSSLVSPNLVKQLNELHQPKNTAEDIVHVDLYCLSIWVHLANLDDQLSVVDQRPL